MTHSDYHLNEPSELLTIWIFCQLSGGPICIGETGSPTDAGDLFPCVKRGDRSIPILRPARETRYHLDRSHPPFSLSLSLSPSLCRALSLLLSTSLFPLTSIFRPRKLLRGRKKKGETGEVRKGRKRASPRAKRSSAYLVTRITFRQSSPWLVSTPRKPAQAVWSADELFAILPRVWVRVWLSAIAIESSAFIETSGFEYGTWPYSQSTTWSYLWREFWISLYLYTSPSIFTTNRRASSCSSLKKGWTNFALSNFHTKYNDSVLWQWNFHKMFFLDEYVTYTHETD